MKNHKLKNNCNFIIMRTASIEEVAFLWIDIMMKI